MRMGELLHRRLLEVFSQCLDTRSHVQRLDVRELAKLIMLTPGEEPADRMQIAHAGILVADGGGEEFQEAASRLIAGVGDDLWHEDLGRNGAGDPHRLVGRNDGQRVTGFWSLSFMDWVT
jgi:hypothetical protein